MTDDFVLTIGGVWVEPVIAFVPGGSDEYQRNPNEPAWHVPIPSTPGRYSSALPTDGNMVIVIEVWPNGFKIHVNPDRPGGTA